VELLIATGNPGKAREFREMLGSDGLVWHDLSEFTGDKAVEETGRTFRANACLKASAYAQRYRMWALADDSGLEVDALGGSPGVKSARWAQVHDSGSGDADNNRLLLQQLESVPDERRTARFVCVLALADPAGRVMLTARDTVEGRMLHAPRGENGFGYDPLFFVESLGKTTAELDAAQKHAISHRGKALRRLRELMRRSGLVAENFHPV
jgi:XTP/dITP diphosphohydrolase